VFSLDVFFSPEEIGILTITWIIVGGGFGIFLTWIINFWFVKTGNFKYYDWICKTLLGCAVLGYLVMGISTIF
jgi:fluoride ion exporter CrcB/FEX